MLLRLLPTPSRADLLPPAHLLLEQASAQADFAHKFIITPVNGTITLAQVNAQVKGIKFLTFTDVISWSKKLNASLVDASTIAVTFTTNKTHGLVNKLEIEGTANVTSALKGKHAPAVGTIINATQVITVAQVRVATAPACQTGHMRQPSAMAAVTLRTLCQRMKQICCGVYCLLVQQHARPCSWRFRRRHLQPM